MRRRARSSRSLTGSLVLLVTAFLHPAIAQQPPAPAQPTVPARPTTPGPQPAPGQPPPSDQPPGPEPKPVAPAPIPLAPIPVIPKAQPIGPPPTVPAAPQRVLPPTVGIRGGTFQFEPSLTLLEEYTDNFNLTERDKQSNFRTVLSPGLALRINSPLTMGLIAYTFSPTYDTATDDVSLFHSLLGQITWRANPRWQLTLADTFTRSDEPAEADRLALRQERRTFTTNTFALVSDYLIGRVATRQAYQLVTFFDDDDTNTLTQLVSASATVPIYRINLFSLGYEYVTTKTTGGTDAQAGSAADDFDLQGHQATLSVSRQISSSTSLGVNTSYGWRNDTSDGDDTDYQIWNAGPFVRYELPGRLLLDASIGVSGLTSSTQTFGPSVSTASSLTYQLARARATLAVDRGFSETFTAGENFGVVETEGAQGTLSYRITPLLTSSASGFYRRSELTRIADTTAPDRNEKTKRWGGSVTLSWRVLRNLLMNLTYTYEHTVTNDRNGSTSADDRNYSENRVQASIRVNF